MIEEKKRTKPVDVKSQFLRESHPLEPFLPENAKALMLGSFPPPCERWTMNFYYPNFQNDMWRIFGLVFFNDKSHFITPNSKSFHESSIRDFLVSKGIALFDTAEEVIRHKGNASDQFLEIIKPVNLKLLLSKIPHCETIITTGLKATDTLMTILEVNKTPPVCGYVNALSGNRMLKCYRMPSSSRAYPKSLIDKAEDYKHMFEAIGFAERAE